MNAILARWEKVLAQNAARPALFSSNGANGTKSEALFTFSEIESDARAFEEKLVAFRKNSANHEATETANSADSPSVIGIQIGNSPHWPAVLLACFRARFVPLPLGRHIENTERDLALGICGARTLLEMRGSEIVISEVGGVDKLPRADSNFSNSNSQLQSKPRPILPPGTEFLKLTSGTTSAPRVIRFRAEQIVADCDNICETMGIGERDRNFGVIPLSHSYGFSNLVTPLLCRGVALAVSEDRMPRAILSGLANSEATVFPGMPILFQKMAALENPPALEKLRLCISAGAPLMYEISEEFARKFGKKIHVFYGSSECGGIGYDAKKNANRETGFAGTPMKNVRIERLDFDHEKQSGNQEIRKKNRNTKTEKPNSEEMQIAVRSAAVGEGYFPDEQPETLGGGRFVPGDIIHWNGDKMQIAGRISDVINVAGRKLNPLEVEAQLARFPGVRQAVVFGVPSVLRHEEAVAYITISKSAAPTKPAKSSNSLAISEAKEPAESLAISEPSKPLNISELTQFAHRVLSAWQVPKIIRIVEEIPTNERGKIVRRDLAKQFQQKAKN